MTAKKSKTSKSKSEETKESIKRSKKKTKKSKKSVNKNPRVIWLYGAHPGIVRQAFVRFLDYGGDKNVALRNALGLSLEDFIVPVHPYPAGQRNKVLEDLFEVETNAVFVVAGLLGDKNRKGIKKLYEGTELVWVHPSERGFHIAMMRETSSITYQQAQEQMKERLDLFADHFEEDDIHIIR